MTLVARLIGTVCFVGYVRPGPGTWGSAVALPWAYLVHVWGGFPALLAATLILFALGWWATQQMAADGSGHDPSEVVADEVIGQWIALMPLSIAAWNRDLDMLAMWPGWIAAFVLFRLFDIWKPWLVGRADRMESALGVMLDDVVAGVFAALGVVALAAFAHGVLM